jgi:hypothetical protein
VGLQHALGVQGMETAKESDSHGNANSAAGERRGSCPSVVSGTRRAPHPAPRPNMGCLEVSSSLIRQDCYEPVQWARDLGSRVRLLDSLDVITERG